MKRTFIAFFGVFLAILCLLSTGTVMAFKAGYVHTSYMQVNPITLDGKWTSDTEWTDCLQTSISANAVFRDKWELMFGDDFFFVWQNFLVEVFNDSTDDAGDYVQICIDTTANGGTAPQSDDLRIDIVGHNTAIWYQGNGTGWVQRSTPPATQFRWRNSTSASPTSSTPHWIYEIQIEKVTLGIVEVPWERIAVYDASNSGAGVQAWPPTSRDVPNDWGNIPYTSEAIPESLSFGAVVLLSSAALIVASYYLRKRPKTTILTPTKL